LSRAAQKHAQRTSRRTRLWAALVLVPTVLAVLAATLGPIASGDLWWHLRTGEWILAHGKLPTTDPFSHTAGDAPWILQEYGSQVLFALTHRLAGFSGLAILGALLSLLILWVVFVRARADVRPSWAAALTAAFALLFALKWELRPQLFSLLFFFWLERCLFPRGKSLTAKRFSTPPARRWLELGLLSMVWVQLHAEALFTPLITFAVFTGALIATLREGAGWRHAGAWLAMAAAALAGTLASPLFAEPHLYALVGRGVPQQYIEEWFRPWVLPTSPRFAPMTLGILGAYVAALVFGGMFALRALVARLGTPPGSLEPLGDPTSRTGARLTRAVSWERLAFLAACLLFALSARRFLWLTWFPLLDATAWLLYTRPRWRAARLGPALLALVSGLLFANTHYPRAAVASIERGHSHEVVDAALFPMYAAEFVRDAHLTGNLYHPYEWGGYLGWVTEQPVFIDGRTVLFEKVIEERWVAQRDPAKRQEIFARRNVEIVIFKHFTETPGGVRPWQPGGGSWLAVWTDDLAVVWVKRGSPNEERARAWWLEHDVRLDARDGITVADVNLGEPSWLEERALLPPPVLEAVRAAETSPGSAGIQSTLGRSKLWRSMGMKKAQRAELRHAAWLGKKFESRCYVDADGYGKALRSLLEDNQLDEFIELMERDIMLAPLN
jgi:hypothetical protein